MSDLQDITTRLPAAFDATDTARLEEFFAHLPGVIDHVMVTAGGPYYALLADFDFARARRKLEEHLWLPSHVASAIIGTVRPGGALLTNTALTGAVYDVDDGEQLVGV
jgi:hypothetical protein